MILVLLFLGLGAYFFWRKPEPRPVFETASPAANLLRQEQLEKLNLDTDSDGLKDWEETIFRTKADNPDTDGDGTKDGEEVAQGRDPTIAGPNDLIIPKDTRAKPKTTENLTASFTKAFLQEPVAQILAGARPEINPALVEAYTDRLLSRSILSSAAPTSKSEIKITKANATEDIANYFESFGNIFQTLGARGANELEIVVEVFRSQQYERLKELESYPAAYDKAIIQMMALSVPSSLADFHLEIINYLAKFKRSVEFMQLAETDPIQAMLAINERVGLNDEFNSLLKKTQGETIRKIQF